MAEQSDRDLLITLVKDMAEVKTIVRDYKRLEEKVAALDKKVAYYAGMAAFAATIIGLVIQQWLP